MGLSPDTPEGARLLKLLNAYGKELVAQVQGLKPNPTTHVVLVAEEHNGPPTAGTVPKKTIVDRYRTNPPPNDPGMADFIEAFDDEGGKLILAVFGFMDDYLAALAIPLKGHDLNLN